MNNQLKNRLSWWGLLFIIAFCIIPTLLILFQEKISIAVIVLVAVQVFFILALSIVLLYREQTQNKENEESKSLFKEFAENLDDVFWRVSPDLLTTIYVSPAYDEIWGRPRQNLYTNPKEWFEAIAVEDQERVMNTLLELTHGGSSSIKFEYSITRPNGDIRYIYARGFPFKNQHGDLLNILGTCTDITIYKMEQQAKTILLDIRNVIEHEKKLIKLIPKILKIVCIALNWDFGEVWMVDPEMNVLRSINIWDNSKWVSKQFDDHSKRLIFHSGEPLPGLIWKTGKLVWLPDLSQVNLIRTEGAAKAGFKSALGLLFFLNGKVIGVIDFFSHEIKKPHEILQKMMESISNELSEFIQKRQTEEDILKASRHDALTHFLNRSALEDNLNSTLKTSALPIAVLIFEINRFKFISAAMGVDNSEQLLQIIAERLRELIPQTNECVARLELSKFAIFLPFNTVDEIILFTRKISGLFNKQFFVSGDNIYLAIDIGISISPNNGKTSGALLKNADLALSQIKMTAGDNFNFCSSELPNIISEQLSMEVALSHAISNNELCLFYQPQINLKTSEICGCEALLRWNHPIKGLLKPFSFIPLAEETGLIITIDEWVLREAFFQLKQGWPRGSDFITENFISVNISSQHFKKRFNLVDYLLKLTDEFNINPKLIEIEITESILLEDTERNINTLMTLINLGFNLALDDFGTGFSSLSYLLRIPANRVKIDKSFIDGLPNNKTSVAVVKSIITLCHSLNKKVIAEGVENKEQMNFLKQEGCDEMQGYYFSQPIPFSQLQSLIQSNAHMRV